MTWCSTQDKCTRVPDGSRDPARVRRSGREASIAEVAGGWSLLCVGGSLGCGRCVATGSGRLAVDFAPMLPNVGRRWDGCSRLQLLLGATALPQPGEVAQPTVWWMLDGDTNLFGPGHSRWAGLEDLPRKQWGLGLLGMAVHGCGNGCMPNHARGGADL